MILLLTTDGDISSDIVTEWLAFSKYPYKRINSLDIARGKFLISSDNASVKLIISNDEIHLDDIGAVWFRKYGFFSYSDYYLEAREVVTKDILDKVLAREFAATLNIIIGLLKDKAWLTNPNFIHVNKFLTLLAAKDVGLSIPDSFIVNDKQSLTMFGRELISKSIHDPSMLREGGETFSMYTTKISDVNIRGLPDVFFPSLAQKAISKIYEVRVFYLLGKCYSMAIFSQQDTKTSIDFRKYNWNKPNRFVPYRLPNVISKSVKKLMRQLRLNSGSIDFIRCTDGKYYFLEVNPTGQFGMTDFPCNYGIHRKVAESLMQLDKNKLG